MNAPPQQYRITSFKDRDEWIEQMLAAPNTKTFCYGAKIIAARVALHHNIETGQCNPSLAILARGTGMSERTVRRMLRKAEAAGWLRTNKSAGRHSNYFELVDPTRTTGDRVEPGQQVTGFATPTRTTSDRVQDIQPGQIVHANPVKFTPTRSPVGRQNSESITANMNSESIYAPPSDSDHRTTGEIFTGEIIAPGEINSGDFAKFWRTYPRREGRAAAEKRYRQIIKCGQVTAGEIQGGAERYAEARRGQDPKYTKMATTWLNAQCWTDEPPMSASTSAIAAILAWGTE